MEANYKTYYSHELHLKFLDRSSPVSHRQRLSFVPCPSSLTQMNFTLQWMARQSKEEKIVLRIRNLHFKVFLHGLCGT